MGKLLECEIPVGCDGAQLFERAHHVGKAFVGGDAEALAVEISKESLRTDSTRTGGLERVKELASGRCDEVRDVRDVRDVCVCVRESVFKSEIIGRVPVCT